MVWSWMEDASEWTIPSPNVHTPQHQESTWVGRRITVVVVAAAAVVVVGAAAAVADGDEIHVDMITIVDMTDMIVMMNTTTDTAGGALRHPITTDTGLAPDLAPTAHDDTKKILTTFFLPLCIKLYMKIEYM